MIQGPSLFAEIGGSPAVKAAVEEFYIRVLADPALQPYFADIDVGALKRHQTAFITIALNGPGKYTGRTMKAAHAGRGITGEHFTKVAGHLSETLTSLGVPDDKVATIIGQIAPLRAEIVEPA